MYQYTTDIVHIVCILCNRHCVHIVQSTCIDVHHRCEHYAFAYVVQSTCIDLHRHMHLIDCLASPCVGRHASTCMHRLILASSISNFRIDCCASMCIDMHVYIRCSIEPRICQNQSMLQCVCDELHRCGSKL